MIILNEAIVSPILLETIEKHQIPVFEHGEWIQKTGTPSLNVQSISQLFDEVQAGRRLLTNSEKGISILGDYLPTSQEYLWSKTLKDKNQVRLLLQTLYPQFFFQEIEFSKLDEVNFGEVPFPVVIKPNIGYSSVGVHIVNNQAEWDVAVNQLKRELLHSHDIYDSSVIEGQSILIEEWIEGEEYAVDGYYNEHGEPIILNVFKRLFKDEHDTSDRIYFTSKEVIKGIYGETIQFMKDLQPVLSLRNYPIHFEFRKSKNRVIPIEINPLRFAGVGTTDLGYHAYGINVYEHYFLGTKPDWKDILKKMDDHIYSFFFAEIPLDIDLREIATVDHIRLIKEFDQVLEYRKLQAENDRSVAVIFYKSMDLRENQRLLLVDLAKYLRFKEKVLL